MHSNEKNFELNFRELEQSRALVDYIRSLADEFMQAFHLTHIWVSKDYFDGRYYHLTNDMIWKEDQVRHNHYRDFADRFYATLKANSQTPQLFMWQSQPSQKEDLMNKAYHYGLHSGFNIVIMQDDHLENYGFGSNRDIQELTHLLPTFDELKMFCLYLRENVHKTSLLQNPVLGNIGHSFSPLNSSLDCAKIPMPSFFTLQCNGREAKLSRREFVCLALFAHGYSIKECACHLHISPRTAEYHLNQIRSKYNNAPKLDLIKSFMSSTFAWIDPFALII